MISRLILSCSAATELMEKKIRKKLSFYEKGQLFLHKTICAACRHYDHQSALLERMFKSKEKRPSTQEMENQAAELQEKILQRLPKKDEQDDDFKKP